MDRPGDGSATSGDTRRMTLLSLFANLSGTHREHEKFYGEAPLLGAAELVRTSRTLKALAERWSVAPEDRAGAMPSPYAGADDLNDPRAVEGGGILFLESGEPPAEIGRVKGDLERVAAASEATGTWLARAMEASWDMASTLLDFPELADLAAERHAIIARDWQSAQLLTLDARQLRRANDLLDRVDFGVAALRADLAGPRHASRRVFAAAELIDQAADLTVRGAGLVRANERPWRVFHGRVQELLDAEACEDDEPD
jgi:hypothetical protein